MDRLQVLIRHRQPEFAGIFGIMEKWIMLRKGADYASIGEYLGISPITARLLRNRDMTEVSQMRTYLYGSLKDLQNPHAMRDLDKAVRILKNKIREGRTIRVLGDYDIDGVNAVYILLVGLTACGGLVDYTIPDRVKDGYGINKELIDLAVADGIDTVVTCDNGIAAHDAIRYAKEQGLTIIVTDHHQVTDQGIPPADAVVDPHQPGCRYPYKELCGAAVAYKVICGLFEAYDRSVRELDPLIENVAIATVGDVVDLTGENRILVKEGLKRLKNTKNPGLRSLITICGLADMDLTAYHIGYVLGPCINASGRLDTAERALRLLLAADRAQADNLATDLKALNDSRKILTAEGVEEAIAQVEAASWKQDRIYVVYLPKTHESLAGIIAGRLREKYHRPVFVITRGEQCLKGSGRSIEGYSMFEELQKCSDLLLKFGGHPMAAGLSLTRENLEALRLRLNENCMLTEEDLRGLVTLDMVLPFAYVTEELVEEIKLLEPFGKGNRKPLFAIKDAQVRSTRVLGANRNAIRLSMRDETGTPMEGMIFGDADRVLADLAVRPAEAQDLLDIAFYPEINEFRGQRNLQVIIQYYR